VYQSQEEGQILYLLLIEETYSNVSGFYIYKMFCNQREITLYKLYEILFVSVDQREITLLLKYMIFFFIFSERLHKFILEQQKNNEVPLCLNPNSISFKTFAR
jgi:hypothetical protein